MILKVLGGIFFIGLALFLSILMSILFIKIFGGYMTTSNTPTGVFNNHIQALSDHDWELTHSYLAKDCDITVEEMERTFKFQPEIDPNEWNVTREFVDDEGALLWFEGKGLQYMIKEDEDWKVSCDGEIQ